MIRLMRQIQTQGGALLSFPLCAFNVSSSSFFLELNEMQVAKKVPGRC